MDYQRITRSISKLAMQMEGAVGRQSNGSSNINAHSSAYPKEVAKKNKNIPSLPEAIIFSILVRLPADILYNVMRFVCRSWYNIIRDPDFIKSHLFRSAIGLFVQKWDRPFSAIFLEMVKGTDNATRRKLNFRFPTSFLTCGDGLVLFSDPNNIEVFHVVNPITKQQVTLAPLPPSQKHNFNVTLAFAPSTSECKVLNFYWDGVKADPFALILTVGVDNAWRFINTEHIRDDARLTFSCEPLAILGFIYLWSPGSPFVLALDVEAEIFDRVPLPKDCQERCKLCMKSESFLIMGIPDSDNAWEFWALMDSKTREWRKLFKIDLKSQAHALSALSCKDYTYICPIAVCNDMDLVIFYYYLSSRIYIAYNVKTGNFFRYLKRRGDEGSYVVNTNVNSLVVLKRS